MNCAEMAAVNGVAADLLDAQGRLVISPNSWTQDGQRNVPADLLPGESLATFLGRHVPGIQSGGWTVMIAGAKVPQHMWAKTFPKHGMLIACRASVGKQVIAIIAIAVLTFFSGGMAAGLYGAMGGTFVAAGAASSIAMIQAGIMIAGTMLINKVLGPKVPKPSTPDAARAVYSLSGQRNRARPYEPLPTLWGEMRVTPDVASAPYTWFEGDDQYLSTILLGGINVHSAADLSVGDTPLTNYTDVSLFHNGFSGMPSVDVPLYSNADTISGAELVNDGDWVVRTSSTGTIAMQFDFEGQLYDLSGTGKAKVNSVSLFIETRPVGTTSWLPALTETLTNATTDVLRRTFTVSVAQGQHEARVRLGKPTWDDGEGKDACKIGWNILRSIQADATDYSAWGRIGVKIKATGQLSGSLDTLRATYRARPIPLWNGAEWVTATTRENGLSNPGAILLQTLRGVYAGGKLQFGYGMQDAQIDIEGLKAFMLHCTARGYTYDKWITSDMSLGQFCQEVALAGMGEFSWTDGSRPTAVFVSDGQPLSGVVNMANMMKASFEVAYNLSNAADGIEYQFLDRERNWETTTLRVTAPGVTTMLNPARITGEGVTSEAHAAVMARYHLAQSLYQYKTIGYNADIEHLDYRRLSVLSVSHDLTQWGFGGRLVSAQIVDGRVQIDVGEDLPALPTPHVGLRLPGERDYRVWAVDALAVPGRVLTLKGEWPGDTPLPGASSDDPAHDTLWCYDFKATPGYRVRVVSMEAEPDLKGAKVSCVPEGPEFWNYVLNGTYEPAGNQSSLPHFARPTISDVRVIEQVNIQGDTEWYELALTWTAGGDYDRAQVWAARDGAQPALVDAMALGCRSRFRIDGEGQYLIRLVPFSPSGLAGDPETVVYATVNVAIAMRNVDHFTVHEMPGGMRRYTWAYDGDRPAKFSGVQIRYAAGDVPALAANWEAMTPLGEAGDIYTAHFESTLPQAGLHTFACRAIDTAGVLSTSVRRTVVNLGEDYDEIHQIDPTPPPTVTGLKATAVFSSVMVEWDAATYSVGRGHARTIVYAARGPGAAFADAVQVAEAYGGPVSFASEPATAWTIWAKHETNDGALSVSEGAPVGATTAASVDKVLDALTGKITEGQLYTALGTRIGLIDGSGPGSVNARIATVQSNVDTINAQLAEVTGAPDHVPAQAYAAGKLVKSGGKLYRSKIAVPASTAITNTTYWELIGEYASLADAVAAHAAQLSDHATRIGANETGLTAEVTARSSLAAQLRGSYTGTDPSALTQGLAFNERQARVAADTANAQLTQGVRTDLTAAQGTIVGHSTAIGTLTTKVAATEQGIVATGERLDVVESGILTGGAEDLVVDPGMSSLAASWGTTGGMTLFAASDSAVPAGAPASRVVRVPAGVTYNHYRRLRDGAATATSAIRVTPGEIIDVSVWVYLETAANNETVLQAVRGTNDALSSSSNMQVVTTANAWVQLRASHTIPAGMTHLGLRMRRAASTVEGTAWYCGFKAERRGSGVAIVSAAVTAEASTRASAIAAEATARQTVAANIGYDNLLRNPTFTPSGDRLTVSTGSTITDYIASSVAPAGAPSANVMRRVTAAAMSTSEVVYLVFANGLDNVPATPNEVFDISVWIYCDPATAGRGQVLANPRSAANASLGSPVLLTHGLTSGWKRHTFTYTTPANTAYLRIMFGQGAGPAGFTSYYALPEVRRRSAEGTILAAAVETEASARAGVDGYLGAQQSVRVDVAGHVAGYGIAGSTPDGSGASATSSFGVRASNFFVAPPAVAQASAPTANLYDGYTWLDTSVTPNVTRYRSGSTWTTTAPVMPFVIQTTPTTINGVTVPAGVYMDAAFMRRFVAVKGQIGSLAVDDASIANISVSKILAGSMVVGQGISSANYVSGSQGWSFNGAGGAEFNSVVVRGTVYAGAGSIGGILIGASVLQSANYSWNSTGFYLGSDGAAYFNNVRTRGSIMGGAYSAYSWPAAGQTGFYLSAEGLLLGNANNGRYFQIDANGNIYAPQFSIVNGAASFGGVLTAQAVNAVNTLNVAGGAITTTRYAAWPFTQWFRPGSKAASIGFENIPSGSSGIALRGLATVNLTSYAGVNGRSDIYLVRNNDDKVVGQGFVETNAMGGGMAGIVLPIAVDGFDPAPLVGYNEYSIRPGGITPGPTDVQTWLAAASISGTGGKR